MRGQRLVARDIRLNVTRDEKPIDRFQNHNSSESVDMLPKKILECAAQLISDENQ